MTQESLWEFTRFMR